ncbi:MAG: TetR/AcrR family transcriptional regulator [Burkholderiaceae bacterium]|nr:TetR/AcrR family transcriptional regulator [Burkholderiaceae bacterium]
MAHRDQGHPPGVEPVPVRTGPVAGARRRLSSAERRRGIVLAVIELASEAGPEGVTTQAIADRVGVTHGALFRHFPDKGAIWAAVFDWVGESLGAAIDAAFGAGGSPLDTLERVFLAHVAFVARHPGVPRILYHELQRPGGAAAQVRLRAMVSGYRARLATLVSDAKAAGQLSAALDAQAAAVHLIGAVQGLVMQATLFGGERGMPQAARRTWALLVDGLRGGRG